MLNKKIKQSMSVAVLSLMAVGVVHATTTSSVGGGTITFSGAVTDTTCNITTNGGKDFTVNLTPITVSQAGTSTGVIADNAQSFTINVSGCSGYDATSTTAQALNISFTGANVSDDEVYLKNSNGSAQGVGIALTKDGSASTKVGFNSLLDTGLKTTSSTGSVYDTGAEGDITYYANYYNYGGSNIATGSVITTATYTLDYQ